MRQSERIQMLMDRMRKGSTDKKIPSLLKEKKPNAKKPQTLGKYPNNPQKHTNEKSNTFYGTVSSKNKNQAPVKNDIIFSVLEEDTKRRSILKKNSKEQIVPGGDISRNSFLENLHSQEKQHSRSRDDGKNIRILKKPDLKLRKNLALNYNHENSKSIELVDMSESYASDSNAESQLLNENGSEKTLKLAFSENNDDD